MIKPTLKLVLLFVLILPIIACTDTHPTIDKNGRENFLSFYEKFGTDSLFQMRRIEFPMIGTNPNGSDERFFWTEENWVLQRKIDENNEDIQIQPILDMGDLVRVRLVIQQKFMVENLYSLINDKWFLTEYSGLHDIEYFKKGKK